MANNLTNYGQRVALYRDERGALPLPGTQQNVGGLIQLGVRLRLYLGTSTVGKTDALAAAGASPGFLQVANGNGYVTGGKTIAPGNWTVSLVGGNTQYQLADQQWAASGGSILNVAGAYLTDIDGNCLAWWERGSTVTIADGETITADDLIIRLG